MASFSTVLVAVLAVLAAVPVAWAASLSGPLGSTVLHVRNAFCSYDGGAATCAADFYSRGQAICPRVPDCPWAIDGWGPSSAGPACGFAAEETTVPTGARGPASGREFDPAAAGGPIQNLDASSAVITREGVEAVGAHLQRFASGGGLESAEQGMLDRLTSIASGDLEPTTYDQNFYTHELQEASRYANLGYGPESGANLGSPELYEVWNNVHTAALEDYGINGEDLFYPGVK